ncbi:MAG: hypothetical protein IKU71_08830 [Kiritimatiellae bacterium]|nr:hypothetical protein [Kiritimatiellia bacterium]
MNFAEMILKRKQETMYKPPRAHQNDAQSQPLTASRSALPTSTSRQESPQLARPMPQQGSIDADVALTRDGRIRRVRRNSDRTGSMSEINVDLDI